MMFTLHLPLESLVNLKPQLLQSHQEQRVLLFELEVGLGHAAPHVAVEEVVFEEGWGVGVWGVV